MRKVFYVLRHTESEGDATGMMQGRGDDDLTEGGIQQAVKLHDFIAHLEPPPTRCITSGLKRTIDVAAHAGMAELGIACSADRDFDSIDLGTYNGQLSRAEMQKILQKNPDAVANAGGEKKEQFRTRVLEAFRRYVYHDDTNDVPLFVTHGRTIHHLFEQLEVFAKHIPSERIFRIEAEVPENGVVPDFSDTSKWKVYWLRLSHAGIGDDPIEIDEACLSGRYVRPSTREDRGV